MCRTHDSGDAAPPGSLDETLPAVKATDPDTDADLRTALRCDPPAIPVRFLYDLRGSELYEDICRTADYYPYLAELRLLQTHANDVIAHIPPGSVLVELGCGDGSKTAVLLMALAQRDGPDAVRFTGIDVSGGALDQAKRNLLRLCPEVPASSLEFIEAEYLPGLTTARQRHPSATLCILWLGSSVGNFAPPEAAVFLADMRRVAGDRASLLLCTDLWKDPAVLHAAYDDSEGVTREFIVNGMCHALRTLGHPDAELGHALWDYEAVVNAEQRRVEMWLRAKRPVQGLLPGVDVAAGDKVLMEISRKFRPQDVAALVDAGGLCMQASGAAGGKHVSSVGLGREASRAATPVCLQLGKPSSGWGTPFNPAP